MTDESHDTQTPRPVRSQETRQAIKALVTAAGGDVADFEGRLLVQMIETCLKCVDDGHDTGQLKLVNAALKEIRYAYQVFNRYRGRRKVAIFGSARTPEDHADYEAARDFGRLIAERDWMSITGAGDGIMKAGHEGPSRESSFGLSIRLPFETTANEVIAGDPKLINFRYFFTRKLMFMSHADAVAVLPGGFGTQDELFESLTLVQTGKSNIVPIVLVEGKDGVYWPHWLTYIRKNLLENGWISDEDPGLFHLATSVEDAVDHITRFYRNYHSSRYIGDRLVVRMQRALPDEAIATLEGEFSGIIRSGGITQSGAFEEEEEHLDLPRLSFEHTRSRLGLVRRLIDRVNDLDPGA